MKGEGCGGREVYGRAGVWHPKVRLVLSSLPFGIALSCSVDLD